MAGQSQTVRACDICNGEPAEQHRIVHNGRSVLIDLCDADAEPLEQLLTKYALASTSAAGYSTSPHRCDICGKVLSRRVHAVAHVQRQHSYSEEESYTQIRPVGPRVTQPTDTPANRPHRCKICKKPYVNANTARRHVRDVHPDLITKRRRPADFVQLIEDE